MATQSHHSSAIRRTEHTEGPWVPDDTTRHGDLIDDGYHRIEAGDGFNAPDQGCVGFSIPGFMPEADAHLIAAAPDLLAALELTSHMYESETGLPRPSQAHRAIRLAKRGAA